MLDWASRVEPVDTGTIDFCVPGVGLFHDRGRYGVRCDLFPTGTALLESSQSRVDSLPPGAHEVDEQREVVDPGMPFGEQFALQPLEPPDRLVEQASDLGDVSCDRQNLCPEAVAHGSSDLGGDR